MTKTSSEIRQTFLDFFKSKGHHIVPSAPMVIKNDPTLMFTNAGMNQFKDLFLGNAPIKFPRIADTQKCLRVSGKHNDLEEVGVDTYHHTMFEMLGNWSFGDYFKKDAIAWAWELLTEVYKIDKSRLYVTVFEGSADDKLDFDQEAYDCWKKYISEDRILKGNKKDNFWEMGDTGPCGPCSEIHCDIRTDEERKKVDAKTLVNASHPQVIEIWNNVFVEFNRKADGSLEKLPAQHVDTGMGFERLCVVLQGKQSNYDTDVFQPLIQTIAKLSGKPYNASLSLGEKQGEKLNIAMRVIADHVRAISFSIADGQLPSNTGAGYVIRRILRRAVRYGYQTLEFKEPFICKLVPVLSEQMGTAFPELKAQETLIEKVIKEEETSFYKTLEQGIKKFEHYLSLVEKSSLSNHKISGHVVFELYDTFGFPVDLVELLAKENGLAGIRKDEYDELMHEQKSRSREATSLETGDWISTSGKTNGEYDYKVLKKLGDRDSSKDFRNVVKIERFRKVKVKGKDFYQLVFDKNPFYAESGGQVGDIGKLIYFKSFENEQDGKVVSTIIDTKKENGVVIHFADKLPEDFHHLLYAEVDEGRKLLITNNHSATHLLHAALRKVLGTHVEQKGSLVNDEYLRFDFSHFSKITEEEIAKIEHLVNEKIRENIKSEIKEMPIEEAKKSGAMALFGEKYGDVVRVVAFDKNYSVELCGGTHVPATGQIGLFKIVSESAVAAGIRRIEAITSVKAEEFVSSQLTVLSQIKESLGNPKDILKSIEELRTINAELRKSNEAFLKEKAQQIKIDLKTRVKAVNGINFLSEKLIGLDSAEAIKDISFEMKNEIQNLFLVLGAEIKGKPSLSVIISENLVKEKNMNASTIVRELAKEIQGGGGGQPFYATAGGTNLQGLDNAIDNAKKLVAEFAN